VDIPSISSTDTLTNKTMSGASNTFTNLPVGVTGITAIANGGTAVSALPTVQGASAFAAWDANQNLSANNLVNNYATTATAAGTTTLTVSSKYNQFFTGSTTQTVTLPVASTLTIGHQFMVTNLSTGVVTVQSSGANSAIAMQPQERALITCILASGTSAASWSVDAELANSAATGALSLPAGTAAQRPTAVAGQVRLNTDSNSFEGYANGAWSSIGGGLNELPQKNYLKTWSDAVVAPSFSTATSTGNITVSGGTSNFYTDAGTSLSVSTNSSLRGTTNYLTAVTSFSNSGTVYVQFPAMTLEGTDLGKPMSVSFDVTGNTTSTDWDAVIAEYTSGGVYVGLIPIAGTASGCTVTPSALLPTGTTTFNGFFVPSSGTSVFALRLRRLAGAVSPRVDTLFVGPQPIRVGAPVTDWVSYTPTGTITTNCTYTGLWRRVGSDIELDINMAFSGLNTQGGMTFTAAHLLNGLNLTTTIPTSDNKVVGSWCGVDSAVNGEWSGNIHRNIGDVYYLVYQSASTALAVNTGTNTPFTISNVDNFNLKIRLPITGWSSNVTMADRSVEEYASSDNAGITQGTSYTGNYSNSINGSVIPQITTTSATGPSTKYRVQFNTPTQATDRFFCEVQMGAGQNWLPVEHEGAAINPYSYQGGVNYGFGGLTHVSSTLVDVSFGFAGRVPTSTTYAAAGASWSGLGTGVRWRVRKVSGGAQVGYPISSASVVGRVDGNAPATGMVGERITAIVSTTSAIGTSDADVTGASLALTAGSWEIYYSATCQVTTGAAASNNSDGTIKLTDSANTLIGTSARSMRVTTVAAVSNNSTVCLSASEVVNISASTTYKLRAFRTDGAGVGTYNVYNTTNLQTTFYAIRRA
jgi:hypothetical protein